LPLNLSNVHVHYITGAAHKFYGPKGIGFLYIRKGFSLPPLVNGGGQERNMRAGTENVAGIVGMAHAMKKCVDHLDAKTEQIVALKQYAMEQLTANIPGVAFNGDTDPAFSNPTVLNFSMPIPEDDLLLSGMLVFRLDLEGVSMSAGSACSSGANEGSHVLNSLGLPPSRSKNALRMSFSSNNTREEVDFTVAALCRILAPKVPV
jgi:cysteine desulfurase